MLNNKIFTKKALPGFVFIFVIGGLLFGIWFWRNTPKQSALEKQLQEVEEQIALTEKRIKELSELSPEEVLQREKEREILSQLLATDDVVVEGVEIVQEGDTKIITNNIQGYTIEIPNNLVVARSISSDHLELHDKTTMCQGDPACDPVIRIEAMESNPKELSLGEWFKEEEEKADTPMYSPREKISLGNQTFYRVSESIPGKFDGYYYYWARGNKIFYLRISKFEEVKYRSSLETLKLL